MPREDLVRIQHLIEAAEAAQRFIAGRQRVDLDTDEVRMPWQSPATSESQGVGLKEGLCSGALKELGLRCPPAEFVLFRPPGG
jgi:hypothetical protein